MVVTKVAPPDDRRWRVWRTREKAEPEAIHRAAMRLFRESVENEFRKSENFDWVQLSDNAMRNIIEETRPLKEKVIEENPYKVPRRKDHTEYLKLLFSTIEKLNNTTAAADRERLEAGLDKIRKVCKKMRVRDQRVFFAQKFADAEVNSIEGWKAFDLRVKRSNTRQVEDSVDVAAEKVLQMQMATAPPNLEPESDDEEFFTVPENERFDLGEFFLHKDDVCEGFFSSYKRTKKQSADLNGCSQAFLERLPTCLLEKMICFVVRLGLETGTYHKVYCLNKCTILIKVNGKYRPIISAHFNGALLEKMVTTGLVKYLHFKGIFFPGQFGFRSKSSCGTAAFALEKCVNSTPLRADGRGNLIPGGVVGVITADARNAFGVVPHDKLIKRVKGFMKERAINWIKTFLPRQFVVVLRGFRSKVMTLPAWGLPQGAAASPPLYSVHTCRITPNARFSARFSMEKHSRMDLRRALPPDRLLKLDSAGSLTTKSEGNFIDCCNIPGWLESSFTPVSGAMSIPPSCPSGHVTMRLNGLCYADDVVLVISAANQAELERELQKWLAKTLLRLNECGIASAGEKTTLMLFGRSTSSPNVIIEGSKADSVTEMKYLGIYVNPSAKGDKLCYSSHYSRLKGRLRQKAEQMAEVYPFIPRSVNADLVRGNLSGVMLHGSEFIRKPPPKDMRIMQRTVLRALNGSGAEKYWQKELRLLKEEQGLIKKREVKSILDSHMWRLPAQKGLENLDNFKHPTLDRQWTKQYLNSIYKTFRFREVEMTWESLKDCIHIKFTNSNESVPLPDVFLFERLRKLFDLNSLFLPGRIKHKWTQKESIKFSAARARAWHVRRLVDSGEVEVLMRCPPKQAKTFKICKDQWPFFAIRDFNELPPRVRAEFVYESFSAELKSFTDNLHRHWDPSFLCEECAVTDVPRYRSKIFPQKLGSNRSSKVKTGTQFIPRSRAEFEDRKNEIEERMALEREIEAAQVPSIQARQSKILSSISNRNGIKILCDPARLMMKINNITRTPCMWLDQKNWANMLAGDPEKWFEWEARIRKLIFKEKFDNKNFPTGRQNQPNP